MTYQYASSIKDRIKEFVKRKYISVRDFQKIIGVSNAYVATIEKSISPKTQEKIAKAFPELNMEWLMTGNGEMFLPSSQQPNMTMTEPTGTVQIAHGGAERINITNNKTEHKMGDSSVDFYQRLVERLMGTIEAQNVSYQRLADEIKDVKDKLEQQSAKLREMESALGCIIPRSSSAGQEVKNVG